MKLHTMTRPYLDYRTVIDDPTPIDLEAMRPKRTTLRQIIDERPSFRSSDPQPRSITPFDKLRARKTFDEGLKVRLGDSTMKKLAGLNTEQIDAIGTARDILSDNNTLLTIPCLYVQT